MFGLVECIGWFFVASILWSFRFLLVGPWSPEAADRTHWALLVFAGTAFNCIALIAFLIRWRGWGWLVLSGVQIADLIFSLTATVVVEAHWGLFSAGAALMLILLFLFRRSAATPSAPRRLGLAGKLPGT